MTHSEILTAGNSKTFTRSSGVKAVSMVGRGLGVNATYQAARKFRHTAPGPIALIQDEPVSLSGDPVECTITCVAGSVELIIDF